MRREAEEIEEQSASRNNADTAVDRYVDFDI